MYYQISLPIETAKEYASQIKLQFEVPVKVIRVNNWGAIYTKYPIPPAEGTSNLAQKSKNSKGVLT